MFDSSLFHGIAVVIDDEINEPNASVRGIQKAIEDAGCHVVPLNAIPTPASVSNLREVAFFILDWKLYGTAIKEIADVEGIRVPEGMEEAPALVAARMTKQPPDTGL